MIEWVGEIPKKVQESRLKWHGHTAKRRRIHRQESDGDGGAGEKGEDDQSGGGWITSRKTCRRENCQRRKCNTEFNGGVSQESSTPHKSGKRRGRRRRSRIGSTVIAARIKVVL